MAGPGLPLRRRPDVADASGRPTTTARRIFGEWNQNKLYTIQLSADGKSLVDINQALRSASSFKRPMDMKFGPDGALYLIEWGSGFGGNNADSGIYRIDYIAGRPGARSRRPRPTRPTAPRR